MKQFSKLQSLVEAAGTAKKPGIGKLMLKLEDEIEKACDAVAKIRDQLQSQVVADYLKAEGFPATETKAAKTCAEAAFQAMKKLEGEMLDLIQTFAMHDHPQDLEDM